MVSIRRLFQSIVLAGAALTVALTGASTTGVFGQVSTPPSARFFGSLTVNGANGRTGAVVTAFAGTTLCGTAVGNGLYNGTLYYVDTDSSIGACSPNSGATITFQVDGVAASVTQGAVQIPPVSNAVRADLTVPATGTSTQPAGQSVSYAAGWNLVGVPGGMVLSQAASPLYTFPAGASAYTPVPNNTALQGGTGYWAYFNAATTITLSGTATLPFNTAVPSNQYIMIGNPSPNKTVAVSGPSDMVVYTYTASAGYTATTSLAPGQGAWAFSATGGSITMQ